MYVYTTGVFCHIYDTRGSTRALRSVCVHTHSPYICTQPVHQASSVSLFLCMDMCYMAPTPINHVHD